MRTRLIAVLAAFMMMFATALVAVPATQAAPGGAGPMPAFIASAAKNNCTSKYRILIATGQNGGGSTQYVNPCNLSTKGAGSIYVRYTCSNSSYRTTINGTSYGQGWVNTYFWVGLKYVRVSSCGLYL